MDYAEYLTTDQWKRLAHEAKERANWKKGRQHAISKTQLLKERLRDLILG